MKLTAAVFPSRIGRARRRLVPGMIFYVASGFAAMSAVAASADIPDAAQLAALRAPSLTWSDGQAIYWFGVPAYRQSFVSPVSVHDTAQALAVHSGLFQQVFVFADKAVLSGTKANWHWVAQIDAASVGTTGTVSALSLEPNGLKRAMQARRALALGWIPQQARLRFSQGSMADRRRVVDQVYSAAMPVDQLLGYLQKKLRGDGWISAPGPGGSLQTGVWRRQRSELVLVAASRFEGSTLFVHYVE